MPAHHAAVLQGVQGFPQGQHQRTWDAAQLAVEGEQAEPIGGGEPRQEREQVIHVPRYCGTLN